MTSADQPQEITARLDDIDTRLEELGDELDVIRTIQNANRRETRANSQTAAFLRAHCRSTSGHCKGTSTSVEKRVNKTLTASGNIYAIAAGGSSPPQ